METDPLDQFAADLAVILAARLDRLCPASVPQRGLVPYYDNVSNRIWYFQRSGPLPSSAVYVRIWPTVACAETQLFDVEQMTNVRRVTASAYLLRRVYYAEYYGNRARRHTAHRFASFIDAWFHRLTLTDPTEWKVVPL